MQIIDIDGILTVVEGYSDEGDFVSFRRVCPKADLESSICLTGGGYSHEDYVNMFAAAARLWDAGEEIYLIVEDPGRQKAMMRQLAEQYGISGAIRYADCISDIEGDVMDVIESPKVAAGNFFFRKRKGICGNDSEKLYGYLRNTLTMNESKRKGKSS